MTRKRSTTLAVSDPQDQTVELHQGDELPAVSVNGEEFGPLDRDPALILAELADEAARDGGDPTPFAAGTFAFYAMPDGGMMTVFDLSEESRVGSPGVQRMRIPPGLIRAMNVLMAGGSRMSAVKALMGAGRAPGRLGR